MATRMFGLCLAVGLLPIVAAAADGENWVPVSRPAQTVTGRVVMMPGQVVFQNGKSLALSTGGQMLFRPEKKKKKVLAELYRVLQPEDLPLENGTRLCAGKNAAYLIVWKSDKVANETSPRTMVVFSGSKFDPGSADECGRFAYDAGSR